MKKFTLIVMTLLFVLSCTNEDTNEIIDQSISNTDTKTQELLSVTEINAYIESELKQNGDVIWKNAPTNVLWSAVVHGEGILSIGYGDEGQSFSEPGKKSSNLITARENVLSLVQSGEGLLKSSDKILADETLNVIDAEISNFTTILALQNAEQIRYLDPSYGLYLEEKVSVSQQKSAGCVTSGENINSADYRVISPNAWLPWNFDIHNVTQAWDYSTGAGITVGLIDTGISASQNLLGNGFNDGVSSGRTVERYGTYIDSFWWWASGTDGPNDKCGHGTQMASALASPRNNDLMPVGVAYNCNLVAYRGTEDVVLNDYHERKGVSNALESLANRSDVKIISMSVGYPWSIGNVKDAVKYAYSKGKMIIAAGGTSTTFTNWYGVIFPASMSETVAVTGIKDNGYNTCDICHDGSKIDFTIVMQRAANTDRTSPVIGFNTGDKSYAGGSSIATATTAGIAALVWATNPSMSRDQVLNKLKQAGEFYPNPDSDFGYGNIDALKAVQ
ncbi:S8 family peptidase [Aquimarina pacifica]|uniref:S8 family peptidase n=1 Tax=Aquimarina pacifica TaxID=1296415 RepID=UPI0004707D96|nr:S8/S53 family peptidase [Aquimarina pacifica]